MDAVRVTLVRRSRRLNLATLGYNSLEGLIALLAGFRAGSIALVGFGVDSLIELTASLVALWRLAGDAEGVQRARRERVALRAIGALFLGLAAYVAIDAALTLLHHDAPAASPIGIALAVGSLVVMPYLARHKRRTAQALESRALASEAAQTALCTVLSAILLGGLTLNAVLGWWWADPVAALAMVPVMVREGTEALRGTPPCDDGCR